MNNKTRLLTLVLVLSSFFISVHNASAKKPFSDISSSHKNNDAIKYVQSEGIVSGYPDGTYKPENTINRAELTKIIIEAKYPGQATGSNCFPDVKEDWFAKYVCFAKNKGIIGGYPDGSFGPEKYINFSEAAKIIVNAFEYSVLLENIWYKPFVEKLEELKAIPMTIQSFDKLITRGEMAEIIYRLKANITDKDSNTYKRLSGVEEECNHPNGDVEYWWNEVDQEIRDCFIQMYGEPESIKDNEGSINTGDYFNEKLNVTIKNPFNWEKIEGEAPLVTFFSPFDNANDDYRESVNLIAEQLTEDMTLDTLANELETELEKEMENFEMLEKEKFIFFGYEAYGSEFTFRSEGDNFRVLQLFFIKDNFVYVLTYTAKQEDYDKHLEDSIEIIQTIDIEEKKYLNKEYSFEIRYPNNWEQIKEDNVLMALFSPNEDKNDTFRENINIFSDEIPNNMTFDQYIDAMLLQSPQLFNEFTHIEGEYVDFSGFNAYIHTYTFDHVGSELKRKEIIFIKDGGVFNLTFTAEKTEFEKYLATANKIMYSLKFF